MQCRAKVVLVLFVFAIIAQVFSFAPTVVYIAGSFPTYFHRVESEIIIFTLFVCLAVVSLDYVRWRVTALTCIGAMMFYALLKLLVGFDPSAPIRVLAIWNVAGFVVVASLAWIVVGAFKIGRLTWRNMFFSLALANLAAAYLNVISRLNG